MMNEKQSENLKMGCAIWLESFLKQQGSYEIKGVYAAGKAAGFSKPQIKAARAWYGKWISTIGGNRWGWDTDD